jgi:hypothetical protein
MKYIELKLFWKKFHLKTLYFCVYSSFSAEFLRSFHLKKVKRIAVPLTDFYR